MTAAVLDPAFRLEDAAEMLGQTPATLLPAVQEAMDAAIMTAAEHAFLSATGCCAARSAR